MTRLRLGTRQSPLALAQSGQVARALEALHSDLHVELVPIVTRGDRLPGDLAPFGGKGLFTEELEEGLLSGRLDLAVHSLKDLPVNLPDGLGVAAYPKRADPRDVLISELGTSLRNLPPGSVLLTGSTRRRAQILATRDDLVVEGVRGNVGTRLERWRERGAAGLILAAAGLERLGLDDLPASALEPQDVLPAPGQGILAVEVLAGSPAEPLCAALDDPATARAAHAERHIVSALGGDCTLPLAAWARPSAAGLRVDALLAAPDGRRVCRGDGEGSDPLSAAESCLEAMYRDGAHDLLAALRP